MGVCGEEDDIAGKVSQRDERSYIPAFFKNKNVGNYEVEDSNSRWIFDVHYTSIVTTLVNTPSQMVGEDIEVTKLLDPFCFDRFNGNNLITRRLSRGVVADCFERSKAGSTYAIVGSLGIGKSWTLIYTLQQALLHENACVLFCFQGNSDAIVCIRRNNCIYVWSSAYGPWSHVCYSSLFDNSNVLVLLVPVFSLKGGAGHLEGRRMLIMAASNDVNHFYSSKMTTPLLERILSVYTEKELVAALPFMVEGQESPPTLKKMLEWAKIVGPMPQFLVSKGRFSCREGNVYSAIYMINLGFVQKLLSFDGLIENNCSVTACIFSVNVRRQSTNQQLDIAIAGQEMHDDLHDYVGYDGQLILNYWNREISIMSDAIVKAIAQSSPKTIHSFATMNKYLLVEEFL